MEQQKRIVDLLYARSEQAITELEESYGQICRGVACNILENKEDAEEIVNDTFCAVWNQIPPDNPVHLKAYILKILRNLALMRRRYITASMRDYRMNICLSELEEIIPGGPEPDTFLESCAITEAINRCLASDNITNRQIFVRRYFGFETCREIAKSMKVTESKVHSILFRMRKKLQEELRKEGIYV